MDSITHNIYQFLKVYYFQCFFLYLSTNENHIEDGGIHIVAAIFASLRKGGVEMSD